MSQSIHNSLSSAIHKCLITDCLFHVKNICQQSFGRVRNELCRENQAAHERQQQKWGKELPQSSLKIQITGPWHDLASYVSLA